MNELISVIVPVYNAERFLDECISSIIGQSYADFELILVNDGSTDTSGDICRRYAAQDPRIVVIDKSNGGVSSARNAALDAARGKWVIFADSDDYYLPGAFEALVAAAGSAPEADMAVATCLKLIDGKTTYATKQQAALHRDALPAMTHFALWGYIFRKEIIDRYSIRFDTSLAYSEDRLFLVEYAIHARSIAAIDKPVYAYRIHPASACRSAKDIVKASRMQFDAISKIYTLKSQAEKATDAEAIDHLCRNLARAAVTIAAYESSNIRKLLAVREMARECPVKFEPKMPYPLFCAYTRLRRLSHRLRRRLH